TGLPGSRPYPRQDTRVGDRPHRRADRRGRSGLRGGHLLPHLSPTVQGRNGNITARVAHATASLDSATPSGNPSRIRGGGSCQRRIWHVSDVAVALSPTPEDIALGIPQSFFQAPEVKLRT